MPQLHVWVGWNTSAHRRPPEHTRGLFPTACGYRCADTAVILRECTPQDAETDLHVCVRTHEQAERTYAHAADIAHTLLGELERKYPHIAELHRITMDIDAFPIEWSMREQHEHTAPESADADVA